ncbi:MAG: hypothetical protein ABEJ31_15005 [Haloarculaceae archaeon]
MDERTESATRTRRRVLRAIGSGAVAGALAGCQGSNSTQTASPGDTTTTGGGSPTTGGSQRGTTTPGGGSGPAGWNCQFQSTLSGDQCSSAKSLSGQITADTTIGDTCSEYTVSGKLHVKNGATLTVTPGTRLKFGQGAKILVSEASALSAAGTCQEPIVFTGDQQTRGYWDGLVFQNADSVPSTLQYCQVEYAGGSQYTWAPAAGNLVVFDGSRVSVEHCLIRESDAYGVVLSKDAMVDSFEHNVVTVNDLPAWTKAQNADAFSATSTYAGNDTDRVVVEQGQIAEDSTWDALDADYFVADGQNVKVHAGLTIRPGSTVVFGQNA